MMAVSVDRGQARPSAMVMRFSRPALWVGQRIFGHLTLAPAVVARIRALAAQGTVVYVMRHRSVVDYFLVNFVLAREGLPLPRFGDGVQALWLRPLREMAAGLRNRIRWRRVFRRESAVAQERELCAGLVAAGDPVLLFIHGRRRLWGRGAKALDTQFFRDVVRSQWGGGRPVFFVPLAVCAGAGLWRRGARVAVYSPYETPGDFKKLVTYLWNAKQMCLTVGREVELGDFRGRYRRDSQERLTHRLARALRLFLYREERVVWGPPLLPKSRVREMVLGGDEVASAVRRLAAARGSSEAALWREAAGYFREMAANYNGLYFAILKALFNRIWWRLFRGLEVTGLDPVVEAVKQHPVVLVPCHRSHFDYIILSYIFHSHFLSPPHIAAGINLSFWPLGAVFRGAGAFFIRRTFEGNELYKLVFRRYLTFLIRQGYTQEFFIEGGRSRTGKILTPRLGMLSAIVTAFIRGVQRDLYFVPVSISYERLVEEEAYSRELAGAEKQPESLGALLRARRLLRRNYGTVYVNFARPVSLTEALGDLKERFHSGTCDPAVERERRRFILKFGFQLLREVNRVAVVAAPAVAATVLLGGQQPACRYDEFRRRADSLLGLADLEGMQPTAALQRDRKEWKETLRFLKESGLVEEISDGVEGRVLHVPSAKRRNLDFYKNNIIHCFVMPSLLSRALLQPPSSQGLKGELWWWLDLLRNEFVLPERESLADQVGRLLAHYRAQGAIDHGDRPVPEHVLFRASLGILENVREAYWVAATTLRTAVGDKPVSQRSLLEQMRQRYETLLLLRELEKPEGNSTVMLTNALGRFGELGYAQVEQTGRGERWIRCGPAFERLGELERRLAKKSWPQG